jgi:ADP-ribose pyrophosphatase YjhB (NUDIX family)
MPNYAHYELKVFMLIRDDSGKLLFMRNDHPESIIHGYVNPPAGHIEIGETVVDAVKREILEETGLVNVSDIKVQGTVNVQGFKELPVFMIVVSCKVDGVTPSVKEGAEGTAVWLSSSELQSEKVLEDVAKIIETLKNTTSGKLFHATSTFENRKLVQFNVAP